jgi:hypothetical protein
MSRFLKLSNRIINTAHIEHIFHNKALEEYTLYFARSTYYSTFMFGTGSVTSVNNSIVANKEEHTESYKTIDKWINSLECVSNEKDSK